MTAPALPRPFRSALLLGILGGVTGTVAWWIGSPKAAGWGAAGAAATLPLAWGVTRLLRGRPALAAGCATLLLHLAAAVASVHAGLPVIEGFKFLLQGTILAMAAGALAVEGRIPSRLLVLVVALPLLLAALARHQVLLETAEGVRLQQVLEGAIARGRAFPEPDEIGAAAKVWVVDRATARIVAAPDGHGGDLGDTPLEHPGRMLTEMGGAYATRLHRHAVVAWRAVPGHEDVGVVIVVYEPTSDFDEALGWDLLVLLCVVGVGVVLAGKR